VRFEEWVRAVPAELAGDSLWKVQAYRLALFAADVGWHDVTKLVQDRRMIGLADQLYRALGSVSANIAEGYSRGSGPDRARFYEYALGSAREARDWYFKARHVLGDTVVDHRLDLLSQVIRLLLTMVPQQRGRSLRERQPAYEPIPSETAYNADAHLDQLLEEVPLP
jgi:four helix bundle protein